MKKGFTLIETLVYLALFALIIGGMVVAAYLLFETSDRYQSRAMLQEEQNFIMAKIAWALDNAMSANVVGDVLTITKYDPPSITIDSPGTNARLDGEVLNSSSIKVDDLSFIHAGGAGTPESVEITLAVSAVTPTGKPIAQTASTTHYIRK